VSAEGSEQVTDAALAIDRALERARAAATAALDERCAGLTERGSAHEHIDLERHDAPDATGDEGLYSAVITLELRARPVD